MAHTPARPVHFLPPPAASRTSNNPHYSNAPASAIIMIVMQRRIFGHIRIQNSISKRRDINIMKKHTKVLAVLSTTAFMAAFAPNFLSNAPVSSVYAASAGWTQFVRAAAPGWTNRFLCRTAAGQYAIFHVKPRPAGDPCGSPHNS